MAATASIVKRDTLGGSMFRVVDVTLDNSYPTGGWALAAKDFGFGTNGTIFAVWADSIKDGYFISWDRTNSKLMVFQSAASGNPGTELTASSGVMNNKVVRLCAIGVGHG